MAVLESFMAYAAAFEETFVDDDWSRLEQYFAENAVYEVVGGAMACRIEGREAIFAGLKKSLDGFDRRMDGRAVAVTSPPEIGEDSIAASWKVTYSKEGAPDYVLEGHSRARYEDGVIVELVDSYAPEVDESAAAWIARYAPDLDPTYV